MSDEELDYKDFLEFTKRTTKRALGLDDEFKPVGNEVFSQEEISRNVDAGKDFFVGVDFGALETRILALWAIENGALTLQDYMDMPLVKGKGEWTWEEAKKNFSELRKLAKNTTYGVPPLMSVRIPPIPDDQLFKLKQSFREAFDRLKVDPCHVPVFPVEAKIQHFVPACRGSFEIDNQECRNCRICTECRMITSRKEPTMNDQLVDVYNRTYGGDREDPDCPACGNCMTQRVAARGDMKGNEFWGCDNYPKCTGTRTLNEVAGTTPELKCIKITFGSLSMRMHCIRADNGELEYAKILRYSQILRDPGILYTQFVEPGSRAFAMDEVDFGLKTWRAIGVDNHECDESLRRKIIEKSGKKPNVTLYHEQMKRRLAMKARLGSTTVTAGLLTEEDMPDGAVDGVVDFLYEMSDVFAVDLKACCEMLDAAKQKLEWVVAEELINRAFNHLQYNFKPRTPAPSQDIDITIEDVKEKSRPMRTKFKKQPNYTIRLYEDEDKIELYLMDGAKHVEHSYANRLSLQREGALRQFVEGFVDKCVKNKTLGSGINDGRLQVLKLMERDIPNPGKQAFISQRIRDIVEILLEKLRAPSKKASFADGSPSAEVQRRWAKAAMEEGEGDLWQLSNRPCPSCEAIGGCMCPRPDQEEVKPECTCERLVKINPKIAVELGAGKALARQSAKGFTYACIECHTVMVCNKIKPGA